MKKSLLIFAILFSHLLSAQTAPTPPFSRGVNLSGWFEQPSPRNIQFTRFDRTDFQNIKSLGADVIRLPINLHFMTNGAPDYKLDPLFLEFLDKAVDWAVELKIHLILDNHTFDSSKPTDPNIEQPLLKVWPQMAAHFRDRSDYILYEVLNEPHGIDLTKWARIQGEVIKAIRGIDQRHTIVVGPANWNSYHDLDSLPVYPDKNLIYTFHFYDPFMFTHQGADWTDLGLVAGIPFPPDPKRMPPVPQELRNNWVGKNWNNYFTEGKPESIKKLLDIPADFAKKRQVPIYCGEYGVFIPKSNPADRVVWYEMVRTYLESKQIAWTSWDYVGGFGLFNGEHDQNFEYELNVPLIHAMGFTAPPQKTITIKPETETLAIYGDFTSRGITPWPYGEKGTLDFYSTNRPAAGKYAIHWSNAPRYNAVAFDFTRLRDFSQLFANGYGLDFKIRAKGKPAKLEIRLVNTEDGDSIPWRCAFPLELKTNDVWQTIHIPLSNMNETGAWKGKWYNSEAKFDWSRIQRIEIVSEFSDLKGVDVWLDDISIIK